MQTSGINNSINFNGSLKFRNADKNVRRSEDLARGQAIRKLAEGIEASNEDGLTLDEKLAIIDGAVAKANANVHPSTIICSLVGMVGAGLATMKFTTAGRKFIITSAESLKKAAIAGSSNMSKVQKEKQLKAISEKANLLREGNPNSKLVDNVHEFTKNVLGSEKADFIKNKMQDLNITNGAQAFDAGMGVVAAATVIDPTSDAIEQHVDNRDILKTVNALI